MSAEEFQDGQGGSCTNRGQHGRPSKGGCGEQAHASKTAGAEKADRLKAEQEAIARRMNKIRHKVLVLSGKGGVGKSTVAVNLAATLALKGKRVGVMDIDIHGPSISKLLKVNAVPVTGSEGGIAPAVAFQGLKVMSIGYFLDNRDDAIIWRGPMKHGVIRQFLSEVEWGELDYLIVDSPPGTGDEPLSIAQSISDAAGAVIVTTPQEVAVDDVRRSIGFCRKVNLPVIGVVENMSGFICPHCGERSDIFKRGGGKDLAVQMNVPYLGEIPLDPAIVQACDDGEPFAAHCTDGHVAEAFQRIVQPILRLDERNLPPDQENLPRDQRDPRRHQRREVMKIAIPMVDGRLSPHFGHCASFALIDVDRAGKEIMKREDIEAPPHQPGLLPDWLQERGVNMIFAGGMGARAQELFARKDIEVLIGAPSDRPEELVSSWLNGTLTLGNNVCDH